MTSVGEIVLIRHGDTVWSAAGRHTSHTDVDLTPDGERAAANVGPLLQGREFAAVWSSPRWRAQRTAELAGLTITAFDRDLVEWNYGEFEGLTSAQIRVERPRWSLWTDGCPGGETPDEVTTRAQRVLAKATALLGVGDVALVGHGHASRVLGACWIDAPLPTAGRLHLGTASMSTLGYEHDNRVITGWNFRARS
jgi:probable phosphoglycerate mutase